MSKPDLVYLKPARGHRVRDHRTGLPFPTEGAFVPAGDPVFQAWVNFGDLKAAEPPAAKPDTAAAAPAPSKS